MQRGFIAEWAVTIILLLFGTTTLVQAFVIPSASMVGTLLIGDHVLVDKLVYAPDGAISARCCRIADVAAATSSSFATRSDFAGLREARHRRSGRSHPLR